MDPNLLSSPSFISDSKVSLPVFSHIFAAAADFYQLAPWKLLREEIPIELRYPQAGPGRIVVVTGSAGDVFGLSAYDSASDLERMFLAQDPLEIVQNLSWLTLCYETSSYIAPQDFLAIEKHAWPIVNEKAYPVINRMGSPGAELYPPTRDDLLWLEAALPALNETFQSQDNPGIAGDIQPQQLILTVQTASGPTIVELCIPARDITVHPGG
jgi:hypothetical protein